MKLTKAEIKYIDKYLIKNEVKFWDVRLELLDHIISAVEDQIESEGVSFNEALLKVHRDFGNQVIEFRIPKVKLLKKGLYQSNNGFKKFIRNEQKELARKQRKMYWKTFLPFIFSSRFILEFLMVVIAIFVVFQFHQKSAFILAMIISLTPEVIKLSKSCFVKAIKNSLRAQLAFGVGSLFLTSNYLILEGLKSLFGKNTYELFLYGTGIYVVLFIFLRHGLNVYIKIID